MFFFGLGGYVRITSDCSSLAHTFVNPPGYCECGKEYSDGKKPSTGVFVDKSTGPRGGSI